MSWRLPCARHIGAGARCERHLNIRVQKHVICLRPAYACGQHMPAVSMGKRGPCAVMRRMPAGPTRGGGGGVCL
eukprot:354850-Chlamydomonas_euryale.AAC.1